MSRSDAIHRFNAGRPVAEPLPPIQASVDEACNMLGAGGWNSTRARLRASFERVQALHAAAVAAEHILRDLVPPAPDIDPELSTAVERLQAALAPFQPSPQPASEVA